MSSFTRCTRSALTITLLAVAVSISATAHAATTADKCEASKSKAAGGYYSCIQKASAKAILTATPVDYSKCTTKFDGKWDAAETAGGGMCPDSVLTAAIEAYIASQAVAASAIIAGPGGVPTCGDGAINDIGEHCDGAALGDAACTNLGYLFGALACDGSCDFDVTGCVGCPLGSVFYKGACWAYGAFGQSCTAVCGGLSLLYDPATQTVAGSSGTDADCSYVMDLLAVPASSLDTGSCGIGAGCNFELGMRGRCTSPATNSAASFGSVARVCACQP